MTSFQCLSNLCHSTTANQPQGWDAKLQVFQSVKMAGLPK